MMAESWGWRGPGPMAGLMVGLMVLWFGASSAARGAPTVESGDFLTLVESLRQDVLTTFPKDNNEYNPPTNQQLTDFAALAGDILAGNEAAADLKASPLGYEVVRYTDSVTNDVYLGVREDTSNIDRLGWGSYFVNLNPNANALVQAPHPVHDTQTPRLAARAFRESGALGFMMAGSHRDLLGQPDGADPADIAASIFHEVHQAWAAADRVTYQLHGFDLDNHPFPADTGVVLSNGHGATPMSPELLDLHAELETLLAADLPAFKAYAYNELAVNDLDNIAVNTGVDGTVIGTTFSPLAGNLNIQGNYIETLGGKEFIHIELHQPLRFGVDNIHEATASSIAASILSQNEISAVPAPLALPAGLLALATLAYRTRRRLAGACVGLAKS